MLYRLYLIFFVTFLSGFQTAFAEDERYRVELLLLRHLNGVSELEQQTILRDFSAALDLLQPPVDTKDEALRISGEARGEALAAEQTGFEEAADTPHGETLEDLEAEPQIVLLETQSEVMQQAWQRLRSSRPYKPELYLSWEQPEGEPFPSIRVHDQQVLVEVDPYTGLHASNDNAEQANEQIHAFTDTTTPVSDLVADENGNIDGASELIPRPIRYYRIDGTATMRKTRFLHLDLDLEYREAVYTDDEQAIVKRAMDAQQAEEPRPSAFRVHTLRQSRQVQTQDMEYFDGPVFAVLALISRVEAATEPDAEAGQATE